ncbi:response regulator transcription factor [Limnobacter sp.]|uniref:response regulator transcription factor n=1 Tax=Limnobacter sp. TaxID=2003368 RepID=UPI0035129454
MERPRPVHVLLLDDDDDLREGMQWMFNTVDLPMSGFASFDQLRAKLDLLMQSDAQLCLLLDLRMPDMSGLEVFEWLKRNGYSLERLPVIFLTGHGDISTAVEAVKSGAFDFYEKPTTDERLIARVRQALAKSGEHLASQEVLKQWSERIDKLSPREREVMFLVAKGKLNKVIASELDISMRTVEVHRANVFEKLKVRSAAELATLLSRLSDRLGFDQLAGLE